MKYIILIILILSFAGTISSCKISSKEIKPEEKDSAHSCMVIPSRVRSIYNTSSVGFSGDTSFADMLFVPGGVFEMGGIRIKKVFRIIQDYILYTSLFIIRYVILLPG